MDDPDLREIFEDEVQERAGRLIDGAKRLALGELDLTDAHDLYREGHTIKGTGRMMGFNAVADAGLLLEEIWRAVSTGELPGTELLGDALAAVAAQLSPAVAADPETGPPELAAAVRQLVAVHEGKAVDDDPVPLGNPTVPAQPSTMPMAAPQPIVPPAIDLSAPASEDDSPVFDGSDLGGLLGSIDSWAFGENVRVNAARLFRLINEICSLRVDVESMVALTRELTRRLDDPASVRDHLTRLQTQVHEADVLVAGLQTEAVDLASVPLAETTNTFSQLVRYIARKGGKEIRFELVGDENSVDKQVLDRISDPLRQLLVNAVHHGIETTEDRIAVGKPPTGTVSMRARVDDHWLEVTIEDDGRGVDWEAVRRNAVERGLLPHGVEADPASLKSLLFSPAFSTARPGDLVSVGDGLATVAESVEALHGSVGIESTSGSGTKVRFTVPTSRALQDAILVRAGGQIWGLPAIAVHEVIPIPSAGIRTAAMGLQMEWRGTPIDVISFAATVDLMPGDDPTDVVIVDSAVGPVGFTVDGVVGRRQVAARELGPILSGVPHLTGAALLGGGDVVVLVDPGRLAERARAIPEQRGPRSRVLVVDDSRGARQVVGGALGSAGFEVGLAADPEEALAAVAEHHFDGIVMDYMLPTMDGAELVAKIRSLGVKVPIVMLSGHATADDQARALDAGVDAYFDKDDVRQGALAASLADLIDTHRAKGAAA